MTLPTGEKIVPDSNGLACTNPIQLNAVTILNTQCGIGTGGIILDVQGGQASYTFSWTPNVSTSNIAFNLSAGTYSVHVVRNNQPDCMLDTTIIVNNSNGPATQVASIEPASCLAANGKVTLTPGNLNYAWSNGTTGAVNAALAAGCYYVTATQPATGCFSIFRVCVPRVNQLNTDFTILKQAKCGRPTGAVQLNVSGGSGNYSYSLGNGPLLSGLLAGTYTDIIQDNTSACADTVMFTINPVTVTGTVQLTLYNVHCAGYDDGYVNFSVTAGANFALPFTFLLLDQNGNQTTPVFPGNLSSGAYTLYIVDADSCAIPPTSFVITEPPPFTLQKSVQPETCTQGGQILLTPGGANGKFTADWADLPGSDNGLNRLNLKAGRYSATFFDSLFCQYTLDTVLVAHQCALPTTLYRVIKAGTVDTFCLDLPVGVAPANAHFALAGGGTTGSSPFGSWVLKPNGCLVYTAKNTTGYALDTICVNETVDFPGLNQGFCIIVSITATEPTVQEVYFSLLPNAAATACGTLPNIPLPTINLLNSSGLSGSSGSFGDYDIDPVTACITFQSLGQSGYNVDDIGVAVCGGSPYRCVIIHYVPSVLPPSACLGAVQLPTNLALETENCAIGAETCIPLPFAETNNYIILDNGQIYQAGLSPCDNDTLTAYLINLIPPTGPYMLDQWLVNGQNIGGSFSDLNGLLALLNILDINGDWHIYNNTYIVGGSPGATYGSMKITSAAGITKILNAGIQYVPQGTVMNFVIGVHQVVFRSVLSGCADTMTVQVVCTNCPPAHVYVPDALGNIRWTVSNCDFDSTFCTSIPANLISNYAVKDNGVVFNNFTPCGSFAGLVLDTGYHQLTIQQLAGSCEYLINFYLSCVAVPPAPADTLLAVADNAVTTKIANAKIAILANDFYQGPVQVKLLATTGFGTFSYESILGILTYEPDTAHCGPATIRYRLTDTLGRQSEALVTVMVTCDKVIVFNGLSPNGDNLNDAWHIPGIEQFPKNEVQVFNRWGSRVLSQKGYTNDNAWNGDWNGKELPDGTYFYIIDLGDGSDRLSGYLEIVR